MSNKELDIYKLLDKVCQPYSTPMPHNLFDMSLKCEVIGLIMHMISCAFQDMRDSGGKTKWECDAKVALGSKITEKRSMTLNALRKYLMECQGADLIEYSKEVGDKIIVKINVMKLFGDILKEEMSK